jgi:5-histidylcysteine sulfoxide synthase/putative 4-mercaptohistidine N1-methyltranferase
MEGIEVPARTPGLAQGHVEKDRTSAAGIDAAGTRTVLLTGSDVEQKRAELLDYFHSTFSLYESLFECLAADEAFYARANTLRHPLIFYYGHTSVFFINKLNVMRLIDERVDPKLESMLAIGVDEMSWDDLDEKNYDWPTVAEVKAHRNRTREIVDRFIRSADFTLPIGWDSPMWIVLMGIEHERIHLETSSVLIRELPLRLVKPHPVWGRVCEESGAAPDNELLPVEGGDIVLGKQHPDRLYGWDNEYGRLEAKVEPFRASKYLVSNQELRAFVADGGYGDRRWWSDEGWRWVQFRQTAHPVFWRKTPDGWRLRTMLAEIDMPWDWPAEVNQLEAKAFCNWLAARTGQPIRLPTEAEWMQLRSRLPTDLPDWEQAPGNICLSGCMSPCPVTDHAFNGGFHDLVGNVWQWTETPIDGYDGFEVHPAYDDFSTPTFDGKHNLIKGGCWISTGNYAIRASRYAFRRHFFQHAGLRYVEAAPLPQAEVNVYETDKSVSEYIEFHWGEAHFGVPNFPVACATVAIELVQGRGHERALDLGCATGRSAFELARHFQHVDAVDFSARLIEAPANLQKTGAQRYVVTNEGELVAYKEVRLADFPGYTEVKDRIAFMQGDACNLVAKFTDYDLVFAGNLIDRLYDPAQFLALIKERIRPGGLLVLTSPYTWLEAFTPREKWLGGFKARTGESYTTLEGLRDALAPELHMLGEPRDIPFVIRETARKFQHTIAQLSVWEKVG